MSKRKQARNLMIVELVNNGCTGPEVASEFNITRQRVHQIVEAERERSKPRDQGSLYEDGGSLLEAGV